MRIKAFLTAATIVAIGFAQPVHADDAASSGGPTVFRRLSAEQYRQIVTDIFGATIKIGGRFEPDIREDGLLAVGSSRVSVTASGLEQYDIMARSIAAQVVDETNRATLFPCKPASDATPDDSCAAQFLSRAGRLLYRRPLTEQELKGRVGVSSMAAKTLKNFYLGVQASLSDMLMSPQFLFRREVAEPDPDHAGQFRLDAFSKASQISFLLWNTAPDNELLAAAESGRLNDKKTLNQQQHKPIRISKNLRRYRAQGKIPIPIDNFRMLASHK